MSRPADLRTDFSHLPCGSRAKYSSKTCRCDACRAANAQYESARQAARRIFGDNALVPADRARVHLAALAAVGIGRRTVHSRTGINLLTITRIRRGTKTQIRRDTERKILALTWQDLAAGARVPAEPTWAILTRLLREGFTKTDLARRLGSRGSPPALQISRTWVTRKTAQKVVALYAALQAEAGSSVPRVPTDQSSAPQSPL